MPTTDQYTLTPLDHDDLVCTQTDTCRNPAVVAIHLDHEDDYWGGRAACADHHPDRMGAVL